MSRRKPRGRPIDLPAVRQARARLDAIAREHPDLVGGPTDAETATHWERELAPILGEKVATMASKKAGGPARVLTFRLPEDLIGRLDWYGKRLADLTGLEVSRTDSLKHALGKALNVAAKEFEALDKARAKERKR